MSGGDVARAMRASEAARGATKAKPTPDRDTAADVAHALAWLERRGTKANRDGMARYGIVAKKVFGVSMGFNYPIRALSIYERDQPRLL